MTVFPNRLRFHSDSQVLYVLGLMTPIVASIAPLQISTVAVLAALAVLLRRLAAGHIWLPLNVTKLSGVLLALVLWGAITTIWSIDYLLGIGTASRLLLASLTLLILLDAVSELDAESQKQLYIWLSLGAAIGITLTLVSVFYIYIDTVWFQQKEMAEHELSACYLSVPWTYYGYCFSFGGSHNYIPSCTINAFSSFWIGLLCFRSWLQKSSPRNIMPASWVRLVYNSHTFFTKPPAVAYRGNLCAP